LKEATAEQRARLAEDLERSGFSGNQLAQAAGISRSTLSRYLRDPEDHGARPLKKIMLDHLRAELVKLKRKRRKRRKK